MDFFAAWFNNQSIEVGLCFIEPFVTASGKAPKLAMQTYLTERLHFSLYHLFCQR
jgi:hypothetical protein